MAEFYYTMNLRFWFPFRFTFVIIFLAANRTSQFLTLPPYPVQRKCIMTWKYSSRAIIVYYNMFVVRCFIIVYDRKMGIHSVSTDIQHVPHIHLEGIYATRVTLLFWLLKNESDELRSIYSTHFSCGIVLTYQMLISVKLSCL